MTRIDPVTFSVIWGGLLSAAAEMGVTLSRTAYSNAVREGLDYSTALFDVDGNMVAQGDYSPGHLGSMAFSIRRVFEDYPRETIAAGDAILLNDPGIGSGHLPDFFMISPIYQGRELLGFAACCAHHVDVGGAGAGSQVIQGVLDNYQEGVRFLPTRCYAGGEPIEHIFSLVAANVRQPDKVLGDLRAQVNANVIGADRVADLARQYGAETLREGMNQIIRRSEEQMRNALREIPDGTYVFEDQMDDVGPDTEPVLTRASVIVSDGEVTVDWAGSGPQREAGLNSYLHYTYAYTIAAVKSVTLPSAPQNDGVIRTIKIKAPLGSFYNPRRPAACGGRAIISHRIYEVVLGALAKAVPERVMAANSHFYNPNLGGVDPASDKQFVCYELIIGGIGGRYNKDGEEALASPWNAANIPVEVQESNNPVLIQRFQFIKDSAGPGRYRGACGVRKDIELLSDNVSFYNLGDRAKYPPYSLDSGKPGSLAKTVLNPDTSAATVLESKGTYRLNAGDVISWRTAGGGGYGNPLQRDAERVRLDVMRGFITLEHAEQAYGVIIDSVHHEIDVEGTAARRKGMGKRC